MCLTRGQDKGAENIVKTWIHLKELLFESVVTQDLDGLALQGSH